MNLLVFAIASLASGPITDRVGPRRVIFVGILVWAFATIGSALSTSYGMLLFFRALVGVGEGGYGPSANVLLCAAARPEKRGRALGIYNVGMAVGGTAGSLWARSWRPESAGARRSGSRGPSLLLALASGTGKELIARAIHMLSGSREGAFVAVNCAAPFRVVARGRSSATRAFTGAHKTARIAAWSRPTAGRCFSTMSARCRRACRPSLARAGRLVRSGVGGLETIRVDVRVVRQRPNRDLETEVWKKDTFRQDLYYRLENVIPQVRMPCCASGREDCAVAGRPTSVGKKFSAEHVGMRSPASTPTRWRR